MSAGVIPRKAKPRCPHLLIGKNFYICYGFSQECLDSFVLHAKP